MQRLHLALYTLELMLTNCRSKCRCMKITKPFKCDLATNHPKHCRLTVSKIQGTSMILVVNSGVQCQSQQKLCLFRFFCSRIVDNSVEPSGSCLFMTTKSCLYKMHITGAYAVSVGHPNPCLQLVSILVQSKSKQFQNFTDLNVYMFLVHCFTIPCLTYCCQVNWTFYQSCVHYFHLGLR